MRAPPMRLTLHRRLLPRPQASGAAGGTARGTAAREGADAVMRVQGTTAAGAAVSVMVRCGSEG